MREAERLKRIEMRSLAEASGRLRRAKERLTHAVPRGSYSELLQQAGIYLPAPAWLTVVGAGALLISAVVWRLFGGLAGIFIGPLFFYHFAVSLLQRRAQVRRQDAVQHLPALVDALEASLAAGYPMETAIEHGADALPAGVLKEELTKGIMLLRTRVALDDALNQVMRSISGQEVSSLIITLRLFSGIGARAAVPLHSLGARLREQQAVLARASRALAGPQQAFFLALGLVLALPLLLCVLEPVYVISAFADPVHRLFLQAALIVQLAALMYFETLIRLRS